MAKPHIASGLDIGRADTLAYISRCSLLRFDFSASFNPSASFFCHSNSIMHGALLSLACAAAALASSNAFVASPSCAAPLSAAERLLSCRLQQQRPQQQAARGRRTLSMNKGFG